VKFAPTAFLGRTDLFLMLNEDQDEQAAEFLATLTPPVMLKSKGRTTRPPAWTRGRTEFSDRISTAMRHED